MSAHVLLNLLNELGKIDKMRGMSIFNVKATFTARFMLKSGKICKNNDHTCLFHCINTCWVPRKLFEHKAIRIFRSIFALKCTNFW